MVPFGSVASVACCERSRARSSLRSKDHHCLEANIVMVHDTLT